MTRSRPVPRSRSLARSLRRSTRKPFGSLRSPSPPNLAEPMGAHEPPFGLYVNVLITASRLTPCAPRAISL
jgi:hypothetical protein